MSTLNHPGPSTSADLMPLAEAILQRTAGLDERMPVIRSGEREPISLLVRQLVHRRDGWRCLWCGASPWADDKDRHTELLNIDHIVPWSAGGSDRSDNLRTLCAKHNEYRSNYRTDAAFTVVLPVVGICDPCRGVAIERPTEAIAAFCGSRNHQGWVADEARIL